MNELVKITEQSGKRLVDARELHQVLKVKSLFKDWIRNRIKEYQFIRDADYFRSSNFSYGDVQVVINPKPRQEYLLTIDMAKELCMVERNEVGRKIRKYFIQIEQNYRQIQWRGLNTLVVGNDVFVNYKATLRELGYSDKSGAVALRKKVRPELFILLYGQNWIKLNYAQALEKQAQIKQLRIEFNKLMIGGK